MNMHEWMSANPRPDRPDMSGFRDAMGTPGGMQSYLADRRQQMGDWRDQMGDWRQERRDFSQGGDQGPVMQHGPGPVMQPGGPNTQFPLNPGAGGPIQGQQIPGSSYGFNLGQILQRFPQGIGQPGLNPGY